MAVVDFPSSPMLADYVADQHSNDSGVAPPDGSEDPTDYAELESIIEESAKV